MLGCLRRENQRGARTARFLYVLWSLGVAWFLRRCYFSVIVDAPLVGCAVVGCLFSCRVRCESGVFVCVSV